MPSNVFTTGGAADPTTALRALNVSTLSGDAVSPGEITVNGNRIYRNNTAAAITVPAVTEPAQMTAAGFTEETTPQQIDEVVLATTDLTGAAPAGAKVGRNVATGQEFSVEGGNWSAETSTSSATRQRLTVATNGQTVFTLAAAPTAAASLHVIVNGATYDLITPTPSFTLSGTTVTWTGPFGLMPADIVVAAYN
jgi:hypothetical protein